MAVLSKPSADEHAQNDDQYEDALEDDTDDEEGIFEDEDSIFESDARTGVDPRMNHLNQQTTREAELVPELMPPVSGKAARPRMVQLIARFDAQGRPQVAQSVNGNLTENFRDPTAAEWQALQTRGRIVSGGLAATEPVIASKMPSTRTLLIGAGCVAAAVGGYYLWNKSKNEELDLDTDAEDV